MMSNERAVEKSDWVSPPGHTIVSILEDRELSVEQFAKQIGEPTKVAQKLLDGVHIIDSKIARKLASVLGASETFWLAREYDYRASISPIYNTKVKSLSDLVRELPIADMKKFGWIKSQPNHNDQIIECLSFFGVSSLAQWHGRYENAFQLAAYRQAQSFSPCEISTIAWLRQGEIETLHDEVSCWSPSLLREQISHLSRLTWYKNPSLFIPKLKEILAKSGVKIAVVRAPKGCTASGAVRILAGETPHIQLSFRYLSDDQFWFTLFHEIGHLLLHYNKMPIIEDNSSEESYEKEANNFAASVIVPVAFRDEFYSLGNSRSRIIDFAKRVGIAPGLIVGQLQHEKIIQYSQMQHLKRRYKW